MALYGLGSNRFAAGAWFRGVPGLFAALLAAGVTGAVVSVWERAQRVRVSNLFSRCQGPKVADEIWRRRAEFMGEDDRPPSRRVTLTALMSDLEGYTAASEKMAPQALMLWVNEYMNTMAELVEAHGGVVDDYAGDGIKANFGFPVPSESEAEVDAEAASAVRCALAMGERMQALNEIWAKQGLPTGRCRVGVSTGPTSRSPHHRWPASAWRARPRRRSV
jgi:adenylate cyclase